MHYPFEAMLVCMRWYAAYPLSFRNIEEMTAELGAFVDCSTLHRWSIKVRPVLAGDVSSACGSKLASAI